MILGHRIDPYKTKESFFSFQLDLKRKTPETVETKTDCKKCTAVDSVPPVNVRINDQIELQSF